MTEQLAKRVFVESSDSHASILAALARIEEVPAGKTLIDLISDADWTDQSVADWRIEVGSTSVEEADELDDADREVPAVA